LALFAGEEGDTGEAGRVDCRRLSAAMAASRSCSSVNPPVDEEATALELDVSYPREKGCWG